MKNKIQVTTLIATITLGITGCAGSYQTPVSRLVSESARLNNIEAKGTAPLQFLITEEQRQQSHSVRAIKFPTLSNIKYVFEPYKMMEAVSQQRFTGSGQYKITPEIESWDYDHLEPWGYWGASFEMQAKLTVSDKKDGKHIFSRSYHGKGSNGQFDAARVSGNPVMVSRETVQTMEGIAGIDAIQDIFNQFVKDWKIFGATLNMESQSAQATP